MRHHHLLVVDDEPTYLATTKNVLEQNAYIVDTATSGDEAIEKVKLAPSLYALVILDYRMPGKDGAQTAEALLSINPDIYLLIYSNVLDIKFKAGQVQFIQKSDRETLLRTVESWCHKYDETTRIVSSFSPITENEKVSASVGLVGSSFAVAKIASFIHQMHPQGSDISVLITGENGTGKEEVARAIHRMSTRRSAPFVALNCGAFPEGLVESELFGHVRGAFTGADSRKIGRFEFAKHGTLLLDEIGEMPLKIQVKLLRVLQEKEFSLVGSNDIQKTDVRVLAATNKDLRKEIERGRFREDLFYRLKVAEIHLPPLRERPEDIEPLVAHFCADFNRRKQTKKSVLASAIHCLRGYPWPGNVRELKNLLDLVLTTTPEDEIGPKAIPAEYWGKPKRENLSFGQLLSRHKEEERRFLQDFLERYASDSKREIARRLGMPFTSFCNTLRRLGLEDGEAETQLTEEQSA